VVEQADFSVGGDRGRFSLQATLDSSTLPVRGTPDASDPNYLDFQKRCQSPGVLRCVGFDSPSDFVPAVWPHSGLYPKLSDKRFKGTMDTAIKACLPNVEPMWRGGATIKRKGSGSTD